MDPKIDPEIDPEIDPKLVLLNNLENVPEITLWNNCLVHVSVRVCEGEEGRAHVGGCAGVRPNQASYPGLLKLGEEKA